MNEQFSEEQIEAYASAFETDDAIWCNGKWYEVEWYEVVENKKNGNNKLTAYADGNVFVINDNRYGGRQSRTPYGFWVGWNNENPYRVTTLEHYELQGGEKAIPMSKFMDNLEFGKVYPVELDSGGTPSITDEAGVGLVPGGKNWAVIPRYEQVTPKETQQEDSTLTILEQKLVELRKEHDELQKDILEKRHYQRKLVEAVVNLEEAIDSLKKIGDV